MMSDFKNLYQDREPSLFPRRQYEARVDQSQILLLAPVLIIANWLLPKEHRSQDGVSTKNQRNDLQCFLILWNSIKGRSNDRDYRVVSTNSVGSLSDFYFICIYICVLMPNLGVTVKDKSAKWSKRTNWVKIIVKASQFHSQVLQVKRHD